jgi:hypothetical protein
MPATAQGTCFLFYQGFIQRCNDAFKHDRRLNKFFLGSCKFWHVFVYTNNRKQKHIDMKQALERIVTKEGAGDKFNFMKTVMMILLFLTFWGVSFYVLVNSFA